MNNHFIFLVLLTFAWIEAAVCSSQNEDEYPAVSPHGPQEGPRFKDADDFELALKRATAETKPELIRWYLLNVEAQKLIESERQRRGVRCSEYEWLTLKRSGRVIDAISAPTVDDRVLVAARDYVYGGALSPDHGGWWQIARIGQLYEGSYEYHGDRLTVVVAKESVELRMRFNDVDPNQATTATITAVDHGAPIFVVSCRSFVVAGTKTWLPVDTERRDIHQ